MPGLIVRGDPGELYGNALVFVHLKHDGVDAVDADPGA
jgi:hypothetical protein